MTSSIPADSKVRERYPVNGAEVVVYDKGGTGVYSIIEPEASPDLKLLYKYLMASLYYSVKPTAEAMDPVKYIEDTVKQTAEELSLGGSVQHNLDSLRYYIKRDVTGYGVLDVPMRDPRVEEVECGGFGTALTVVHRDYTEYLHLQANVVFESEEKVRDMVQKLAQRAGKSVTVAYPFTDFILPEGHRGAVTYAKEVSLPGSTFDIRKFPEEPLTVTHLLSSGTMSSLILAYYWLLQEHRAFSFVIGPVSAGKTTMINILLSTLRQDAKILTVEDTPELRLVHPNWVRFITRSAYSLSGRDVGLFDLVKLSLRYRPDYLVLGEVRGEEVQSLVQAAAVGHGAITSFHAESPDSALVRLMSPPLSVGESFVLLVWTFLKMARVTTKLGTQVRRVVDVTELVPEAAEGQAFGLKPLFKWRPSTDSFTPGTTEELVNASYRLNQVKDERGWSRQDLVDELEGRKALLEGLVAERVFNYREVASRLFSFKSNNGES